MKKLISLLMLFAILLSCCACGTEEAASTPATESVPETTQDLESPEVLYGHIDQTKPVDGVYQIWNAEGVKLMMTKPDAKIQVLCDIDMGGATLTPIAEFTGELNGGNVTISNFTLQGGEEDSFGFVTVNKGKIHDLIIADVTFVPGKSAKHFGALVGTNAGELSRCTVSGTMTVPAAADSADCGATVGTNTGTVKNINATVDVTYTAPGSANVGGIVGSTQGGAVEYCESHGKLTVTGQNKTVGLFAGKSADVVFNTCVFGGADNSLDGKLFTNFTGNAEDDELAVAPGALWRDNACIEPLPESNMALRQKVVDAMYDMCSVKWKVRQDLVHTCTCLLEGCHGTYSEMYTYYGVPYNHKRSSYARFVYCLDEEGYLKDWVYDQESFNGFDLYIGSDCSACVQQAWLTVSNSVYFTSTRQIPEVYGKGPVAVGDYVCDFELQPVVKNGNTYRLTDQYINATDYQVMMDSYAAMRPGDAIVNQVEAGGHTRMIASYPVIVRDQEGKINAEYSYVLTHEQGASIRDDEKMEYSSCRVNWKYTFANLYESWYVPVACPELVEGKMDTPEATLEGGCQGYAGMYTGKVQANFMIDSITLKIVDEDGNVVLDKPYFITVQDPDYYGGMDYAARSYIDSADLADLARFLPEVNFTQGKDYSYTVTANLATFDNIVVNEGSFTYG